MSRLFRLNFSISETITIPSQELDFLTQSQYLSEINFEGSRIETIIGYAFFCFNNFEIINLAHNPIEFICKHAFEFSISSEKRLYNHFNDVGLNENSLDLGAFTNSEKPLTIDIRSSDFTTLIERIFGPILKSYTQDRLIINGHLFNVTVKCNGYLQVKIFIKTNLLAKWIALKENHFGL